jgi:hypothetical protein
MKKSIVFFYFIALLPLLGVAQVTINPGVSWLDNAGNVIQAHGGSIVQVGNTFYWYGEDRSDNKSSQKINCYSSADLKHWTFRRVIISSSSPGMAEANLERPKVIYNATTKQYVLWVHKENIHDYSQARALVASCSTPDGEFKLVKEFRPFGNMSRDCTLFQEQDGTAYFVSSANENADLICYKLTPDYLDVAEQHMLIKGGRREAPVIFKKNGTYYLCSSSTTGWGPNYNTVQKASNIYGPYGPQQGLYGSDTWNSYDSQTAFVLNIKGTLIMIADRWKGWKLADSRYLWLPIRFDKGNLMPIEWGDSWTINPATGDATAPLPSPSDANNLALNKPAEASIATQKNGNEARCAFDNDPKTKWCANDGDWPHWIKVDLGKVYTISGSSIKWERDNGTVYQYTIESSNDDKTWRTVVDKSKNTSGDQTQTDALSASGRYFRLKAIGHTDVKGGYSWASLYEWQLLSGGTNVALNKKATSDSEQSGTYAAKANDGDYGSTWFTGGPKLGSWWSVDLGANYDLTGCKLTFQDPGFYYQYKIEVSADKTNWTTVIDKSNTDVVWSPVHQFTAKQARYLRITADGLDDGCWLGLREVEVFNTLPLPVSEKTIKITGSDN